MINWKKAAELVAAGKARPSTATRCCRWKSPSKEGVAFPDPRAEVAPRRRRPRDGKFIIVSGKLTPTPRCSFEKIQAAIRAGKFESRIRTASGHRHEGCPRQPRFQLGPRPLHTQYDSKPCLAYTSLYVDSQVAKWNYCEGKVLDKISVHYNIGHLMAMEGDSDRRAATWWR